MINVVMMIMFWLILSISLCLKLYIKAVDVLLFMSVYVFVMSFVQNCIFVRACVRTRAKARVCVSEGT